MSTIIHTYHHLSRLHLHLPTYNTYQFMAFVGELFEKVLGLAAALLQLTKMMRTQYHARYYCIISMAKTHRMP